MRNLSVIIGMMALGLVACSKEKAPEDTTQTHGAMSEAQQSPQAVSTEEIRTVLLTKRPSAADSINSMIITNDNGVVTMRGNVEDEATHADLVNRVRSMPNVRSVRDELQVMPRSNRGMGMGPESQTGTTNTTQGQMGGSQMGGSQMGGSQMGGSQMGGAAGGAAAGAATGAAMGAAAGSMSKSESVRAAMQAAQPKSATVIQNLTITDDGTMVTLSGNVPDEATHQKLLKAAKDSAGTGNIKDDIKVQSKTKQGTPKQKTTPNQ
jgi:osmotically-inducible protein OsmY